MTNWLTMGEIFPVNAKKYPDKIALADKDRQYTFSESNHRVNQLAHALMGLGIKKGDKVSCLLENSIEICELYFATAKIGAVINPVNFRVSAKDVAFIVDNADSKVFIVHDLVNEARVSTPVVFRLRIRQCQMPLKILVFARE